QSLDIKDITDVQLPLRIDINEGENYLDFGMTRAADIKGQIVLQENNTNGNGKPITQSVIIEVASENEVFRKICEIDKPFDFTYLRPGQWTVKVYRNGLNRLYKIQNDTFEVNLEPGQEHQMTITIIKQE